MCRPIHTMARGYSPLLHHRGSCCSNLHLWLDCTFWCSSTIITDRGRQFESSLWNELTKLLGSKRARTTAYHPQSNGMVERFHCQLKATLKAQPNSQAWMDSLPLVLLGIRTALKEDIHSSAAEMVYGTTLRLPGEFFAPPSSLSSNPAAFVRQLRAHMQRIQPSPPRSTVRKSQVSDALSTCTHVFVRADNVRKPLQPPYNGPYLVVACADKYFTLNINGRKETVSMDQLKPAHLDSPPTTPSTVSTEHPAPPNITVPYSYHYKSHTFWSTGSLATAPTHLHTTGGGGVV